MSHAAIIANKSRSHCILIAVIILVGSFVYMVASQEMAGSCMLFILEVTLFSRRTLTEFDEFDDHPGSFRSSKYERH